MHHDRAPAKINLFLHVFGRRDDGYHLIESLVGFADVGDDLALELAARLSLTIDGPMAGGLVAEDDNLVLRAARLFLAAFPAARAGRFSLTKNLPVASGLGGGSSDAAAALRLLCRANQMDATDPRVLAIARELGADVPVCVEVRPRLMRGIGHELGPVLAHADTPALLINPGVAVETRAVFSGLGLQPGQRLLQPAGASSGGDRFARLAAETRNDLEAPAKAIAPKIERVLKALSAAAGCQVARMSGSGATCFGLFESEADVLRAAEVLRMREGLWWLQPCRIQVPH
ncbi:MAG: 4-(cytidine 5'-diphospho)-2-C-methyl-D-erythritol kinase [Rhizobiales bacterium PAR1]|nr:MAG: 4-(cytidine 5'-diphospho)-2-C-methyl-D-erythritol kinase [Rhizobiales bacterium PAR1]